MLQVILLILKIIGIVLAVMLGIVILLLCTILFVPIRYKLAGNANGDIKNGQLAFRVNWLLHLLSIKVDYQDEQLDWQARIAWVRFGSRDVKEDKKKAKRKKERIKLEKDSAQGNSVPLKNVLIKEAQEEEAQTKEIQTKDVQTGEEAENTQIEDMQSTSTVNEISTPLQNSEEQKKISVKKRKKNNKKKNKWSFLQRIREKFQKIKYTIKNIYAKIKEVRNKKDTIMEFLRQDGHKRALQRLKKEGLRFLKTVIPKKCVADIVVGFKDPSTTGQFLAGYSVVFPFLPERVTIRPDFERSVFEGRAMLKGHLRMVWLVLFIWKMIRDKDVRETYYDVKRFKFKEEL